MLDALEAAYPMLRGAIRDHGTVKPREFMRFLACARDLSVESADAPVPGAVAGGGERFLVVEAIARG